MATSRRRKRPHRPGAGAPRPDLSALPEEWRPWFRRMAAADEAERRGDPAAVLEAMATHPVGPDGRPFWRPWRRRYLEQLCLLGEDAPRWVVSRWLLAQAAQSLDVTRRSAVRQAGDLAVALSVGLDPDRPGESSPADLDHDWVFRQLLLFELGAAAGFVRRTADRRLVARAEPMDAWCRAPMVAVRLDGRTSDRELWVDVATGEPFATPNIGSGWMLEEGETALGRLVPVTGGARMFESAVLHVPESVARDVAADPADWLGALRRERDAGAAVSVYYSHTCLATDVPTPVWQRVLLAMAVVAGGAGAGAPDGVNPLDLVPGWAPEVELPDAERLAGILLPLLGVMVNDVVASRAGLGSDLWSCLGAALLEGPVVAGISRQVALDADAGPALTAAGRLLAEPAAGVARWLVGDRSRAA